MGYSLEGGLDAKLQVGEAAVPTPSALTSKLMQPPRRKSPDATLGRVDRLADWLLTYCPLLTLSLLTALVSGSPSGIPSAWPVFAGFAVGDVGINLFRWRRRAKRATNHPAPSMHRRAAA